MKTEWIIFLIALWIGSEAATLSIIGALFNISLIKWIGIVCWVIAIMTICFTPICLAKKET